MFKVPFKAFINEYVMNMQLVLIQSKTSIVTLQKG